MKTAVKAVTPLIIVLSGIAAIVIIDCNTSSLKELVYALSSDATVTDVTPSMPAPRAAESSPAWSTVALVNATSKPVTVFVAFGAGSVVLPQSWPFCGVDSGLACSFSLAGKSELTMPDGGRTLNATFSFDKPVTCNTTKAEVNVNNPVWYDVVDISLVDGFNKALRIDVQATTGDLGSVERPLGPVWGKTGNERNYGVFPDGCDVCTARLSPPCGMPPGTRDGCKQGSQYKPDVPCQYQGTVMGGGGIYRIVYLGDMQPMGE